MNSQINSILNRAEKQLSSTTTCFQKFSLENENLSSFDINNSIKYLNQDKNSDINQKLGNTLDILYKTKAKYEENQFFNEKYKENIANPYNKPEFEDDSQKESKTISLEIRKIIENEMEPFLFSSKNQIKGLISDLQESIGDIKSLKNELLQAKTQSESLKMIINNQQIESNKSISSLITTQNSYKSQLDDVKNEINSITKKNSLHQAELIKQKEVISENSFLLTKTIQQYKDMKDEMTKEISNEIETKLIGMIKSNDNNLSVIINEMSSFQNSFLLKKDFFSFKNTFTAYQNENSKQFSCVLVDVKRMKHEMENLKKGFYEQNDSFSTMESFIDTYKNSIIEGAESQNMNKIRIENEDLFNKIRGDVFQLKLSLSNHVSQLKKEIDVSVNDIIVFKDMISKGIVEVELKTNENLGKINSLSMDNKTISEILNRIYHENEALRSRTSDSIKDLKESIREVVHVIESRTEEIASSIRVVDSYRIENFKKNHLKAQEFYSKIKEKLVVVKNDVTDMNERINSMISEKEIVNEILYRMKDEIDKLKEGKQEKQGKEGKNEDGLKVNLLSNEVEIEKVKVKEKFEVISKEIYDIKKEITNITEEIFKVQHDLNEIHHSSHLNYNKRPLDPFSKEKLIKEGKFNPLLGSNDNQSSNIGHSMLLGPIKSPRKKVGSVVNSNLGYSNKKEVENWDDNDEDIVEI